MQKPFKILSEEDACGYKDKYAIVNCEVEAPDGQHLNWAYVRGKDLVIVLPIDSEGNVFIKREWRLNRNDFVWEVVSGWVDDANPTDEQVAATAVRELQEEVGHTGKIEKLLTVYASNHWSTRFHLFLAADLVPSIVERDQVELIKNDEVELLDVQKLPFDQAYDLVVNQQIPTAQNALIFLLAKERMSQ